MIEKIKRLFISEAGEHINKQAKEIINAEGELDEQRMKFSSCLQEYYSLKNNRNKTSDLINRLQEISENRDVKSFWLSILTGAVIGVLVSASNAFIDDNAEIWVVIIILAAILALISIVGWYSYSHLSPYDRFYLQEQEKELIENILEDRRKGSLHPTAKP